MTLHNNRLRNLALLVGIAWIGFAFSLYGAAPSPLDDLLGKLPAQTSSAAAEISRALVRLGPTGVEQFVSMLVPPGKGDDTKARFALRGLAIYVSRPGAKAERKTFAETMAAQLRREIPVEVKGFVIRQLQLCGGREAIVALSKELLDEKLCEYAAQALLVIGPKSSSAFREALLRAAGPERRTIIQALGILRDREAVSALLKFADSTDADIKLAALDALGNIGDPAATETLMKASLAKEPYEKIKATAACLQLAQRLAEANRKKDAERIYGHLWDTNRSTEGRHVRCAVLEGLASTLGLDATDWLLTGLRSKDPQICAASATAAVAIPGREATQRWVEEMKKAEPDLRANILSILARRGDALALPAALAALKDKNEIVRRAAISAAVALGQAQGVAPVAALLASASGREREAARQALERIPGEAAVAAMAKLVPSAPAQERCALLDILGKRRAKRHLGVVFAAAGDKDESVRVAAFGALGALEDETALPRLLDLLVKDDTAKVKRAAEKAAASVCARAADKDKAAEQVLARLKTSDVPSRCALLRVVARTGAGKALEAVRAARKDKNPTVQDAALRAMADWPNVAAAPDLLQIAKGKPKAIQGILALRGYVRLAGLQRKPKDALRMYEQAMRVAVRPEEKKKVLGGLSNVGQPEALAMALSYLGDAQLKAEAAAATVKLAKALQDKRRSEARAALRKVIAEVPKAPAIKEARKILRDLDKNLGCITPWQFSGPYTKPGKAGNQIFDVVFPPEDSKAKDVKWQRFPRRTNRKQPWRLDLSKVARGNNRAGYLRTYIWSPKPQPATLKLGSDDGIKVWLNGKVVHANNVLRSLIRDEDKVKVALKKGWNPLMLKVTNNGGGWEASACILRPDDSEIEGLRFSLNPKP